METGDEVIGPVNLGNPAEFTIRELAEIVIDITGSTAKIVHRALPADDPKQHRPDISKAQELLDLRPTISLREGLAKAAAYFEQLLAGEAVAGVAV
jgi:UDP-glucuronate decarboxylase